jgi:hypothetical protein
MTFSPNRVAIDKLKTLLEDGEAKDFEYLIAHIEALIPTSEAVRDYLRKAKREFKLPNLDPSDPTIPYRARRWRAHLLIYNICYLPVYERTGKQVRKIPSSEITTTKTTQQHNNTKAGKDNGSK